MVMVMVKVMETGTLLVLETLSVSETLLVTVLETLLVTVLESLWGSAQPFRSECRLAYQIASGSFC